MNDQRIRDLFCDIYWDYQRTVYGYFYSVFRRQDLAEELTQTTFEKIWRFLCHNSYFIPVQLEHWVFRVVKSVKNDFLRRKQTDVPTTSMDTPLEDGEILQLPDEKANADFYLSSLSFWEAFEMLEESEQALLRYKIQGLTSAQMEKILNIPASTLRSRTATAKKHFRKQLKALDFHWDEWFHSEKE